MCACVYVKLVQLCPFFVTLWTVACWVPLSRGFSTQKYRNGLSFPTPGDLPNPGMKPVLLCLLHWQAGSLPLASPGKPLSHHTKNEKRLKMEEKIHGNMNHYLRRKN